MAGIGYFLGGGKVYKRVCLHHWLTCLPLSVAFRMVLSSESGLWIWELVFTCGMSTWQKVDFVLLEPWGNLAGGEEVFGEERERERLRLYMEDVWLYLR